MTKLDLSEGFQPVPFKEWAKAAAASIKAQSIEPLVSKTADGIALAPIYTQPNPKPAALCATEKRPALAWDIVQAVDIPDLQLANRQILEDLENGASGLSIVLPGSLQADGFGVEIKSKEDFKKLFVNVELDLINLRLDGGASGYAAAMALLEVYKERRYDLSRCQLDLSVDPVSRFARSGKNAAKQAISDQLADLINRAQDFGFKGPVLCADGRVYHEAGASSGQELGFVLATILEQLRLLNAAGFASNDALSRISLLLSVDANQFADIAKLRAMKLLWARLAQVLGCESRTGRMNIETSGRMMSGHDPYVNMLRTTTAAFAAGIAGADSLCILPFTKRLGLADEFSRRMARNCQIILQEESGIGRVCDAGAGSGFIEDFSLKLAETAWAQMQKIEAAGGMMKALADGLVAAEITAQVKQRDADMAVGKKQMVGVNAYASLEQTDPHILDFSPSKTASLWEEPSKGSENVLTCPVLQKVHDDQIFDALRQRVVALKSTPMVDLICLGTPAQYGPRASWAANALAAGGIKTQETVNSGKSGDIETSKIACLCSSDAVYAEQAVAAIKAAKDNGYAKVLIAGKPQEMVETLAATGIDEFLFAGCDLPSVLGDILGFCEAQQ